MFRPLLILLGFVALTTPLSAQEEGERSFDALIEEGLGLREQGDDAAALAVFQECVELRPESGQAIGQVAFAEMALGHLVLAEAHLIEALGFEQDDWVARHRTALEQAQQDLNWRIATVEVLGEGHVSFVESGQSTTRQTPVVLRLSPGRHELHVTSPGFESVTSVLRIEAGQRVTHIPARRPSIMTTPASSVPSVPSVGPGHSPLIADDAADHYLARSIRLDVTAGLFALGAIGTGIAARGTRPDPTDASAGRSIVNGAFIGIAVSAAALAVVLFISARVARGKHRRRFMAPSY